MARIPTQARRSRIDDDGDEAPKKESPRQRVSLASHLLSTVQFPNLGRPPRDDEEKRQVLSCLVYLKSSGKTNKECSELLDISERTVVNYLNEPAYVELQHEMQSVAKERGHSTISMLIDDALNELFSIMKTDKSGFVRFKAAEKLLDVAGYNMPREERQRDSRDEVTRFLSLLEERQQSRVQVNMQVNIPGALPAESTRETIQVVESETREIPEELAQYYQLVGPGGRMPGSEVQAKRESLTPAS